MDNKPTDLHPALTLDRLQVVAQLIVNARRECMALRNAEKGDNGWASGCRAYAWICLALVRATVLYPWLTVIEGGGRIVTAGGKEVFWTALRFVLAIGGAPLRFYRGEPGQIPKNSLRVAFPELTAKQDAFRFRSPSPSLLSQPHALRLAVETDDDGEVTRITLLQVLGAEGKRLGERWLIFEAEKPANVAPFPPRKEEGKELGKPSVGSRKKKPEEERGEE
jgi:hypothetical protein